MQWSALKIMEKALKKTSIALYLTDQSSYITNLSRRLENSNAQQMPFACGFLVRTINAPF